MLEHERSDVDGGRGGYRVLRIDYKAATWGRDARINDDVIFCQQGKRRAARPSNWVADCDIARLYTCRVLGGHHYIRCGESVLKGRDVQDRAEIKRRIGIAGPSHRLI